MKAKALFLALGLVVAAVASQQAIRFTRNFKEGDSDTYKMHMVAGTAQGDAKIDMSMTQAVKKVYENGDADIQVAMSDMHVNFNGNEMSPPTPKPMIQRVDKHGMPIGAQAQGMASHMQFAGYAGMFYDKDLKVGETYPIDVTDPQNAKRHTTGTFKIDNVTDGVAKVISTMNVATEATTTPMKIDMTVLVDTTSSKVNHLEGAVSDLQSSRGGMPFSSMTFTMDRVK